MGALLQLASSSQQTSSGDWWSEHATLIVGVVGIIVSGFIGPSVTSWWTARRERDKDNRAVIAARRDDLRELLDLAADHLGGAVSKLRPALDAQLKGLPLPSETADYLGTLFPLGQRLRLRLPVNAAAVRCYDEVRVQLTRVAQSTNSQTEFDAAVEDFEKLRANFLEEARKALVAPISAKAAQ